MKSIETSLRNHLDQEVTALCTCWTITRVDGTVLRFTDSDEDVTQDGDTYQSIGAYKRTAIESTATLSVDNLEIVGAATDLALPEEELRAGLFDNAQVTIFMTSWLDSVKGKLRLRRGFFGEVQTLPNNTFQVELRGIMQRLAYNYTDIFSSSCLYDLGQPECGIIIKGADLTVGQAYDVGEGARIAQTSYARGKAYDIGWGDPDFETAGSAGGVNSSLYWYNSGVNDLTLVTDEVYAGPYSARGNTGAGTLTQDIDLEADTGLSLAQVDAESCFLTLRAFRRDNGEQGRLRVVFEDRDGEELGYGQALTLGASGFAADPISFAGDFTVELWVYLLNAPTIDESIFGQGSFGGPGQVGTRFSFENGTLALRIDDDVLLVDNQIIVQSGSAPVVGEWRHIALTRSGTTVSLIENFEVTATGTYAGPIYWNVWGDAPDSAGFTGYWDELRVWSIAREPYELAIDGKRTIDPATANLFRYYSFDDLNGADLTGGDLTFSFGPGPNIQSGLGSPMATSVTHATGLGSATYDSGYADVGTTWTEIGTQDHLIPQGAKTMSVNFDVLGTGSTDSRIDNLTGHIINTAESGIVIGYMTNNVAWRCTIAGTSNASSATGGIGSTLNFGGLQLVGEDSYLRAGRVLSSDGARTFVAEVTEPRAVDAWFNGGAVVFETGANAGVAMEVKSWVQSTGAIELFLSLPSNIKAGDYFSIYPGCDKSRISCAAIFRNVENMFATPDVPGQDDLFRYPDAK